MAFFENMMIADPITANPAKVDNLGNLNVIDNIAADNNSNSSRPVFLTGDPNGDFANINILEQLVDDRGDLKLQVNIAGGILLDSSQAIKISDGIIYQFAFPTIAGATYIIDTLGYASIQAHSTGTVTIAFSNDKINFLGSPLGATNAGTLTTTFSTTVTTFPCYGRYIRLLGSGTGLCTIILKFAQSPLTLTNLSGIGGTTPVTAGVAGIMAIGGNIAVGTAPTANPIPLAWDGTNTRRILTDASSGGVVLGSNPLTNGQTLGCIRATVATPAATVIKASPGRLTSITVSGNTGGAAYFHLYNATSVTFGTTSDVLVYQIGSNLPTFSIDLPDGGLYFSTGICGAFTGGIGATDNTLIPATPNLAAAYSFI